MDIQEQVRVLYDCLRTGDRPRLETLLAGSFTAQFTEGLPAPIGGVHQGRASCIDDGWWAIGARYRVTAEPREWVPGIDGSLTVLGSYVGSARATGRPLRAGFAHHWTGDGEQLTSLRQYTDSAAWLAALEPAG